jgi:hypothetical protein
MLYFASLQNINTSAMITSYRLYEDSQDDFEARIRILTEDEGGRYMWTYNGIRWDFRYAFDPKKRTYWLLYPDFYDADGNSFPQGHPLPTGEWLYARMYHFGTSEGRRFHQEHVRPGTSFYCVEGSRIVAEGTVTRITGLFEERQ